MKRLIKLSLFIATLLTINSCAIGDASWHESARRLGAKSVYIHKDGTRTTGEEWYKNHPEEDRKFQEKYGKDGSKKGSVNPSQVFVGME